ncbi:hypothetical protein MC7420_7831 [Coleofasciculus chthonoplastes PCC 7420]|uniref:DUF4276 family protein n=1 Tax=Coleofasciculus chthonoplastes PCC 7420 TaxID=118168 RepID=B4VIL2_9CYAN|nr:DUF4276 family protein [Coleofasciculus chthonoplastes]EDX78093.1 hypothetical protein MC7420_7831 [Coleofasciculus chthonoplastes PCC 7420]
MKEIRYTLLSDGSSDKALLPILTWLLRLHGVECAIQSQWADFRRLPQQPQDHSKRIELSLNLYPCDLLFIHRDAEKEPREKRVSEIKKAVEGIRESVSVPFICVVPVRMTEAWLLFDEAAIRRAAENPRGKQPLNLPNLSKCEELPDPKQYLCQLLRQASGLTGRRLKKFRAREREKIQRIAELIDDFSALQSLSAFQLLEADIKQMLKRQSW